MSERDILDRYYTDPILAAAIVERVAQLLPLIGQSKSNGQGPTILEPSAGTGNFLVPLRKRYPYCWIDAVDLDGEALNKASNNADATFTIAFEDFKRSPIDPGASYATGHGPVKQKGYDLIIGNPPFKLAEAHCRHAFELLAENGVLAFLLRINFRGSGQRIAFFKEFPHFFEPALIPRPSFTGGGNDMTEYAIFIWRKVNGMITPFGWINPEGAFCHGVMENAVGLLIPVTAVVPPIIWRQPRLRKRNLLERVASAVSTSDDFEEI